MADKISIDYQSGFTLWALIWNTEGQVWNRVNSAFEAYSAADLAEYNINLTELPDIGEYQATFPNAIAAGVYTIRVRRGSVAESAPRCGGGVVGWDGASLRPLHTVEQIFATAGMVAGKSFRDHCRIVGGSVGGEVEDAGTGVETFYDYAGNVVMVVTVDSSGNRSSVVYS